MKSWLFGKEIPYFKPLRHELDSEILEKIEISQELILEGWTKESTLQLINRKGFLDPHYPNYIRTSEYLITIQHYLVEKIELINSQTKELKERLPIFYNDFIKNNTLTISDEFNKKGIMSSWVYEDLKLEGKFVKKEDNHFFFDTPHFHYEINGSFELINVFDRIENQSITRIEWNKTNCEVFTGSTGHVYENDYMDWLVFLNTYQNFMWSPITEYPHKVNNRIDDLNSNWVVNPKVWKCLKVTSKEEKEVLLDLFKEDWRENAYIVTQKGQICEVSGWRFFYIWDGFILDSVLTSSGKQIENIKISDSCVLLNGEHYTTLEYKSPRLITDLLEGNLVCMLPRKNLSTIQLHPHAIQRYEERIDEHSYLYTMLQDILNNVYLYGKVVSGAHNEERRKIETERYGYVLSDELVISVWDKKNAKKKKSKKRKSANIRHLDKMHSLFEQIKN